MIAANRRQPKFANETAEQSLLRRMQLINFNRILTRLAFAVAAGFPLVASSGASPPVADAVQRVLNRGSNVVVIYAENRRVDNLF